MFIHTFTVCGLRTCYQDVVDVGCAALSSLSKHFPALLERCAGANQKATDNQPQHGSIRVLVPLCGKTVDLMWSVGPHTHMRA